jgi:uncharacterized protein (TIGR02246 family)
MKKTFKAILILGLCICSCKKSLTSSNQNFITNDSLQLVELILDREQAMIKKDVDLVMSQFSDDATWINSQGYLFEGKRELGKFHSMFFENDSLNYYYEIGIPKIRFLDHNSALAYYSWKMFWIKKENPADTTFKEIGLMTLNAQKEKGKWQWTAITNQHTPWFFNEVKPVQIE